MKCFDPITKVPYPDHEEFVEGGEPRSRALGFCARCGEITDRETAIRLARRGHRKCTQMLIRAGIEFSKELP